MRTRLVAFIVGVPLAAHLSGQPGAPAARAGRGGVEVGVAPAPVSQPDHSQEAFIIEQSRTTYRFENDGTGRRETYVRVKTQSEAGVQHWGQLALGYNAATERIDIQFVRVRKADGTVVTAPADAVQDLTSPVQREAPVYTDFRQKHVTVPSLRPGETLEFSVATTIHTPLAAGHFWLEYSFQKQAVILDERLDVDVPSGRTITLKTQPGADPVTTESNGRRQYRWASAHTTTAEKSADDQKAEKTAEPERAAIRLTTFQNWDEVGRWYSTLEKAPRTPTAEIRRKAEELTAGKATELEKLEALYDFVAKNFRYVSISLGAGRYQPRAAADVLRDQYGDCKDKHTLLASLMASLGLSASTVLINSSVKLDPEFPSPSQFDHAITRATVGKEAVWLDVTTEVAPFRLLSANLRKKQALIVSAPEPAHLEETPPDPPMVNSHVQELDVRLGELGKLSGRVKIVMRGDLELLMRIAFRNTPAARWKDVLEQMNTAAGIGGEVSEWKVSDPAATREPFEIQYQVSKVSFVDWTKKKVDLRLPLSGFDLPEEEDAKTEIELGSPIDAQYRLRLELGSGYQARVPVAVSINRDYGDYRGTYKLDGNTFSAERGLRLHARTLPADRAGDYAAFRRVVSADSEQALALDIAASSSAAPPADLKAADLNRSGYEALRNGDYAQAVTLLTRVVELEPKDRTAWNNLGRAHLGLRRFDPAIDAFKKQIEINPYDESAHTNLGFAYMQQRRYAEAETAFRRQLEVNPLDKFASANLGRLYIETKKYEEAIPELQKAISLSSDDASLQVEMGTAYLNLGRNEDALAAFGRAAELSPTPGTWNNVAYQLALRGVHLDRAQQYAESAVAAVTAESRNFSIGHITTRELAVVESIAAYWDTLGWVLFAKGDLPRAERLVASSWWIAQHSEVGDHLAQIYEKQGRRADALRTFAVALSADRPAQATRDRLAALAGGNANVDELVRKNAGELVRARTVRITVNGATNGSADFFVLVGPEGVEAASFISGEDNLRSMAAVLRKSDFGKVFPNEMPAKILRRGTLTCQAQGTGPVACTFMVMPSGEAQPAK